jgi:hypothetical protein
MSHSHHSLFLYNAPNFCECSGAESGRKCEGKQTETAAMAEFLMWSSVQCIFGACDLVELYLNSANSFHLMFTVDLMGVY